MTMKSATFQRLWQTLTRVYHGIGERSAYVYTQGKIWVAKRPLGEATRHAGQQMVASWQAISWQTLPLPQKALLVGVGALVLLLAIWKVPQWQAASWIGRIEPKDVAKLENDTRTTLIQAVGGLALLIGLLFTWRNTRATERASQETLRLSQEGQLTERFTRAIQQLGSSKLEIRLGGIYALERIARDSERDHWPIMEVLTAYVRVNAPWKEEEQRSTEETLPRELQPTQNKQPPPKLAPDIQAILTVLGRRARIFGKGEGQPLDLSYTDLSRANLQGAQLQGAKLEGAQLQEAGLAGAQLQEAGLAGAQLQGACLWGAHLQGTALGGAQLQGAILWDADLLGAQQLTVEQLSAVRSLYRARLGAAGLIAEKVRLGQIDPFAPTLLEPIQRQYPHLLERPQEYPALLTDESEACPPPPASAM